ncbi:unnamed protein product, partial [marine sediment metagenome]
IRIRNKINIMLITALFLHRMANNLFIFALRPATSD